MLAKVRSAALHGINAYEVTVEVDIHPGVPYIAIVGLPDTAVNESKERVRTAMKNAGLDFPLKRLTLNLAPADVRKEGPAFDLPIAVGLLAASEQISPERLEQTLIIGELALDGNIRPANGVLSMALFARDHRIPDLLVPAGNLDEAAVVAGVNVYPVTCLSEVMQYFNQSSAIIPVQLDMREVLAEEVKFDVDMSDIKGQGNARRALEVAAAGGHNILLIGPPGSGKTMLARRMPTIMPPMLPDEALQTTQVYSVSGALDQKRKLISQRPFRSPHHTSSYAAIVGGGMTPKPGEISMAHHGVLFLDELPEFRREVLESLRQPLEDGFVTVSRVHATAEYPAVFLLIAAMNPCPCGFHGDHTGKQCTCHPASIRRYIQRISGPVLDRIDMHIEVPRLRESELIDMRPGEASRCIRERVIKARSRQEERLAGLKITTNAQMNSRHVRDLCPMSSDVRDFMLQASGQLGLSARAFDRILKLARTIADMANEDAISIGHVQEAVNFRLIDRKQF